MTARFLTACLTIALPALGAEALEMTTPTLRLVGEPVAFRWTTAGTTAVSIQSAGTNGLLDGERRIAVAEAAVSITDLAAGAREITIKLLGEGDAVLEQQAFPVTIVDPAAPSSNRLRSMLPAVAARLKAKEPAKLLALGPATAFSVSPACPEILAAVLGKAMRGSVEVVSVPTGNLTAADALGLVPEWLEQHHPTAVLLAGAWAECAAGVPAPVAAGLTGRLAAAWLAAGVDVIVVGPPPRPAAGEAGLSRSMRFDTALRQALDDRAAFMPGAASLWPDEATGFAQLDEALSRRVTRGGALTAVGQYVLAEKLLRMLRGDNPEPRPMQLAATASLAYSAGSTISLTVTNTAETELWTEIHFLRPVGLSGPSGLMITLPAGGEQRLTRPVALPIPGAPTPSAGAAVLARSEEPILAVAFCSDRSTWPIELPLATDGLAASFRPQYRLADGPATALLRVTSARRGLRRGQVVGPPGVWQPTFEVRSTPIDVEVPLPPLPAGRGALQYTVEAVCGAERAPATTIIRYAGAMTATRGETVIDGDLGDWAEAAWFAIDSRDQILEAPDGWDGEADGLTRFALRYDDAGLALAATAADDSALPEDALELLVDARPGPKLAEPGTVRRLAVPLAAGEVAGAEVARVPEAGVIELRMTWQALGLERVGAGLTFGLDVVRIDADQAQAPTRMSYTGERWAALDSARLGLVLLGRPFEAAPVRLLIGPDDGEAPF